MFSGILAFAVVHGGNVAPIHFVAAVLFAYGTSRLADFFPWFALASAPVLAILAAVSGVAWDVALMGILANLAIFVVIQFGLMGIPDSIVARDWRIGGLKLWNSIFTVAPTTVSLSMSVYYASYLTLILEAGARTSLENAWAVAAVAAFLLGMAGFQRFTLPRNQYSKFHKPDTPTAPHFKRLLILNIDGCRKDIFDSLDLPTARFLRENGTSHAEGLTTVYRALTNPAFASILTGTAPEIHGVRDNNLGQSILTEGLPDIVPTIAYGSMHVKHFCKHYWETRIVSLPRHSVYGSDDIAVEWMKDDILTRPEVRLFVFDFSEADFLGHAYGSTSQAYKDALGRVDARIGKMIAWLDEQGLGEETGIIVCSDHGIAAIDHSYLIARSERYVPFYLYGKGIRKGHTLTRPGKIMDICLTAAWLLGLRYPAESRGQVFTDAVEGTDPVAERKDINARFNRISYQLQAGSYACDHVEIYDGDGPWWDEQLARLLVKAGPSARILDVGCGAGFVGERILASGLPFESLVCQDQSPGMLQMARQRLGDDPRIVYLDSPIDAVPGTYDIVTTSSIFHHFVTPEDLAAQIDRRLASGGVVMGAHEPNRLPFTRPLYRLAATTFKALGGGFRMKGTAEARFNTLLRQETPASMRVTAEEVMQIVEYHSPVEQYDRGVDPLTGFEPGTFVRGCFPTYDVTVLEDYTTFFHRPGLKRHPRLQAFLGNCYRAAFGEGNLFRFVLRKKAEPCRQAVEPPT